jgi:hypothetical protein
MLPARNPLAPKPLFPQLNAAIEMRLVGDGVPVATTDLKAEKSEEATYEDPAGN